MRSISYFNIAHRWASENLAQYGFLLFAALPLSILLLSALWLDSTCGLNQVESFREILGQLVDRAPNSSRLSQQALVRLTAASHLSVGIAFFLLAASLAVVFISWEIIRRLTYAKIPAVALALVIAGTSIVEHFRSDSCLKEWYFVPWYPPLKELLPYIEQMAITLVVAANLAIALLVVAVATFHRKVVDGDPKWNVEVLADQLTDIRRLLYSAAILFTVSVFSLFFGLYVNVAVVSVSHQKIIAELVANLTFVYGITASVLLLTAFFPCLAKLRTRAYALARLHRGDSSPRDFLSNHGLEVASLEDVKPLLVVLGPLLASTTAAVIKLS